MNTMQAKDIQAYLGAYCKEAWDPKDALGNQRVLELMTPPAVPPPVAGGGVLHSVQKGYQALGRLAEKHPGKVTTGAAAAIAALVYGTHKIRQRSKDAPVVMTEEQAKAPATPTTAPTTTAPATPTDTTAPTKEKAPLLTPGQKNLMIGGGVGLGAVATLYLIDKALSRKTKRAPKPRGAYYNG
jgi:hypothetical protein